MASLKDVIDFIVRTPNHQMAWGRIPADHVVGTKQPKAFVTNDDYVIVRLGSMFLKDSRVLWLKLSPLAHSTVDMAGRTTPRQETAVIGPVQFGDLATAPAERSVVLNQRLAGPAVWRGGDLTVAAGLFAVPRDQAAVALLDTLGQLASLALPGLAQGLEIAKIVKTGVEGVLGLDGTRPVLAVKVALGDPASSPLGSESAPCVLAGIAAPSTDVAFDRLWVRDGRLLEGATPDALRPYESHDHLLVTVERGAPRQDWRGLPSLTPHEKAFDAVLRTTGLTKKTAAEKMNAAFVSFDADLTVAEDLTDSDKDRIRSEVVAELKSRLERKFQGPFGAAVETRSVRGAVRTSDSEGFDFLDVGDAGPETVKRIPAGQRPF